MTPFLIYLCSFFIALASGFLQSMSGFGYSVISMSTLPLYLSPISATTVSGIIGNIQSVVLSWKNRLYIQYRVLVIPLVFSIIASFVSISLVADKPSSGYKITLGIFLIIIALYMLFFDKRFKIKATIFSGIITGIISGVANGLFGMGGPPAVMYIMAATKDKNEYLSTIQFFFLISGLANTIARIINGALTTEVLKICLVSIIGMLIGGATGSKLFNKLTQNQINKFIYGFMAVMGLFISLQI